MNDREFWLLIRQALLMFVDAIERRFCFPRTSDLRRKLDRDCLPISMVDNKEM
jgi:hypothetical protein